MAENERTTAISFANGSELKVKASPDEMADTIAQGRGGELVRVIDSDGYAVWINPEHIVSVTSHELQAD
jgi:uncharacterized protein YlzI (FlbEa/FlbD family)